MFGVKPMFRNPASDLKSHLSSGEKLLWSGRPRPGIIFQPSDFFMIPFSLLWGGFAIVWEVMVLDAVIGTNSDESSLAIRMIFPLFGMPFVIIGIYLIFGRFWVDKRQREKTVYGVTNQRILILSGILSPSLKSLNLRSLSDITLSEKTNGFGAITFGNSLPFGTMFSGMSWWPGASQFTGPTIDFIPKAKEVYEIIRKAYSEAT